MNETTVESCKDTSCHYYKEDDCGQKACYHYVAPPVRSPAMKRMVGLLMLGQVAQEVMGAK